MAKQSLPESEAELSAIHESIDAVSADTVKWASEHLSPNLKPTHPYCLPVRDVDRADILCNRIHAIVDCVGIAAELTDPRPNDDSVFYACDAVREMVTELHAITNQRAPAHT